MSERALVDWELEAIASPQWEKATRVHDWRNHVPEGVRVLWPTYTQLQREALYRWADDLASAEEWD